jgi:hypothetical protein
MIMRDLETSIVRGGTELLNSHTERLAAFGMTWRGPDIEVWQSESHRYTSEVRVTILKGSEIHDVFEFHIYRDGQPLVTTEEATNWLNEQLKQLEGQRK